MGRPDFVIIGAMKCATTTLHVQLARQDGFHMSRPKEPNFFSDDERYARFCERRDRLSAELRRLQRTRVRGNGHAAQLRAQGVEPGASLFQLLKRPEYDIIIDLKMGDGTSTVFTCDFSIDYVRINADYRT